MSTEIKTLFQCFGKAESLKRVLEATAKLRQLLNIDEGGSLLSAKAQKIKEHCISLGPSGAKLAKICSILLDEDIVIQDLNAVLPFVRFSAITARVPTTSNKNYKEVQFQIICSGQESSPDSVRCLRINGGIGESYVHTQGNTSIATDSQITNSIQEIYSVLQKEGIETKP